MSLVTDVDAIVRESSDPVLGAHGTWCRVPLRDVATILNGYAFKSSQFSDSGMPLIRIRDITEAKTVCCFQGEFDKQYLIRPGDLLVGMDGEFKTAVWRGPAGLLNQRVCKITPKPDFYEPRLLALVLPGYLSAIHSKTSSQTVTHLSSRSIGDIPLPLPPITEQRRIVEKVEALLEQVNRAKERLDRVPLILKRFRQAILASALTGELLDSTDRDCWPRATLGSVIEGFEAGRNLRALGRPAKAGEFGVLKISAVTWGSFRPEANKALLPGDEPKPHERVRAGDLLISRANTYDLVGAVVLVDQDYPRLMLPDKILRLRVRRDRADSRYLMHALRSEEVREYFEHNATGTSDSMRNLSQPKIAAAPLVLPPLDEQGRIAAHIDRLMIFAEAIERRILAARARAGKLPQAILSKAFSGELVPTEAELARAEGREYETGAQLLERITQAEPSPQSENKRETRRTTPLSPSRLRSAKRRRTELLAGEV